ncbi:uncharacterized protein LOC124405194 [Diprion similis]|uniref:uncharacterized protein LOC124405194 n=1 Tax=Diprion similis TaxID=362088 RepID=UPI001EF9AB6B|nr:uncharacterized protein LOC124405194 [Diprion similis]
MFCYPRFWYLAQCICRRPVLLVILTLSALFAAQYLISDSFVHLNRYQVSSYKSSNKSEGNSTGFLVSNSKCQIPERNPFDPLIRQFVTKEKFEPCTKTALLTRIVKMRNGELVLRVNLNVAKNYVDLSCCWAPIHRSKPSETPDRNVDSKISLGSCINFKNEVIIPANVEVVLVKCKAKDLRPRTKKNTKTVYENVHSLLRPEKVSEKLSQRKSSNSTRKLSVLLLGIDNVARWNFERSMPITSRHLKDTGWIELKGYNKMGENTFPNLMAVLTGMNDSQAMKVCKPTETFGFDNCPMIWYSFKNTSYVTAYGEDTAEISTFHYYKAGFVNPPTDFYLRPYIMAAEKYLPLKRHLDNSYYCTGPELSGVRVFNYALEFAKTFIGVPYFGFFWTNSMSHDNINGVSSVDSNVLDILQRLDYEGILNDSMVIFLSDHGMRYGLFRETIHGWYEDKLPFIYVWLPEWFKAENGEASEALRANGRTLTSPFNLYETLRDILARAGGDADPSSGCPHCQSLFSEAKKERGCEDVGVSHRWCACTRFGNSGISNESAHEAANKIVSYIDSSVERYKNSRGKRICYKLRLKKILRVNEMFGFVSSNGTSGYKQFLYQLQVMPGNGKFEALIQHHEDGDLTIVDGEVSRINSYASTANCLDTGPKPFCYCD